MKDFYSKLGFPTVNIKMFQGGYSNKAPTESLKKLTLAIDIWIENNYGLIPGVRFSPKFDDLFLKENGYRPYAMETLVGDCVIVVKHGQNEDVTIG